MDYAQMVYKDNEHTVDRHPLRPLPLSTCNASRTQPDDHLHHFAFSCLPGRQPRNHPFAIPRCTRFVAPHKIRSGSPTSRRFGPIEP